MPERLIMMFISMIDEMMTLPESEQVGNDDKKAYYVKSFDERDDEAKALTRQIDESVTNAIEIRQMQQAECSRHQGVPSGDEVGASRPCEATCEQADGPGEATTRFHS